MHCRVCGEQSFDPVTAARVERPEQDAAAGLDAGIPGAGGDAAVVEVHAAIVRGQRLIEQAFRQQIERAQRAGQLAADLDPSAVSQALLMSLQGLLTLVRAGITDLQPGIDATFRLLGGTPASAVS